MMQITNRTTKQFSYPHFCTQHKLIYESLGLLSQLLMNKVSLSSLSRKERHSQDKRIRNNKKVFNETVWSPVYLHMTDAIGDFVGNADIGKAFDTLVAQALFQTDFGGRGFGVHLRKFAFQTGKCDGQA